MKIAIFVPGWPTNLQPERMPFFYQQVTSISKNVNFTIDVYVPVSILSFFKLRVLSQILRGKLPSLKAVECKDVNIIPVYYFNIPLASFRSLSDSFLQSSLRKAVNKAQNSSVQYQLCHAHFYSMAKHAFLINKALGIPYVVTEHASNFALSIGGEPKAFVKSVYKAASRLIAVSQPLKSDILENIGFDLDIDVIHNGVDTEAFSMQRSLIDSDGPVRFLFVGHLNHRKWILPLIETLSSIPREKCCLTIVGEGPLYNNVKNCIREESLSNIFLVGAIDNDDMPRIINDHDYLVLPSLNESFGVVVIEAGACGVPSIVSRCGGPESIIVSKYLGMTFEAGISKELKECLVQAIEEKSSVDHEYICRYYKETYSWERISSLLVDVYKGVTSVR